MAYNLGSSDTIVTFSDGKKLTVPANSYVVSDRLVLETFEIITPDSIIVTPKPTSTVEPTSTQPTTTPNTTPTTTPTGDFTSGVDTSGSTPVIWLQPNSNISWVDVHYKIGGNTQQNYRMTLNIAKSRCEQGLPSLTSGSLLQYSFTYFKDGIGINSQTYKYNY